MMLSDEDLGRFSAAERAEIGAVAFTSSFLPHWIEPVYPLPPMLLEHWVVLTDRSPLAESSQDTQAQSNAKASSLKPAPKQAQGTTA